MRVIACCGYLYKQGNLNISINLNLTVHVDFYMESSQRIFTLAFRLLIPFQPSKRKPEALAGAAAGAPEPKGSRDQNLAFRYLPNVSKHPLPQRRDNESLQSAFEVFDLATAVAGSRRERERARH